MLWVSCLPTASLFLLLLRCLPAQNGGGNEQPTEVISVWEGDSINIICSISDSGNHKAMQLKTSRRMANVVYLPTDKPPNISPDFAGRVKCSREGRNYRITLHNAQESDSNVYTCTEFLSNGHHKMVDVKRAIVVVKAKTGGSLRQSPLYASPQAGQSVSITCEMNSSAGSDGIYLLKTHVQPEVILNVSNLGTSRVSPAFAHRLNHSREGNQMVITLHNLQKSDTDNYVCVEEVKSADNTHLLSARGTMVLVQEGEQACCGHSWIIYILITVVIILFCVLACCTLHRVNIKKYFQETPPNTVYEDMSYRSRGNTLVRTNTYSKDN
ncbi:CD7 protein, partial [Xiphorhynchus elegans]|nr:CD7 protein [Xiphorhynchus elegans]